MRLWRTEMDIQYDDRDAYTVTNELERGSKFKYCGLLSRPSIITWHGQKVFRPNICNDFNL